MEHSKEELEKLLAKITSLGKEEVMLLCMIYYTIAANLIGDDLVRQIRDQAIDVFKQKMSINSLLQNMEPLSQAKN